MNTTSTSLPEEDVNLLLPGRSLPAGAGWDWVTGGWRLFLRAPLMWIISLIIVLVAFIAIGIVPILGTIAIQVLQPVAAAGFIVACHSLERGGNFELEHLFAGFKRNFGSLVMVGVFFLVGMLVIVIIGVAMVAMTVGTAVLGTLGDPEQAMAAAAGSVFMILLAVLVMMALLVPLLAAYWFAPALVVMHGVQPVAAMKESFAACLRNLIPFLLYGVITFVLAILAAIPFGLGYLVLMPVIFAGTYVAYRQIFTYETAAPTVLAPDR
jgi:uncharacterized membrane protein